MTRVPSIGDSALLGLVGDLFAGAAEAALPAPVGRDRRVERLGRKVPSEGVSEVQLGVRKLPLEHRTPPLLIYFFRTTTCPGSRHRLPRDR